MLKSAARALAHLIFRPHAFKKKRIRKIARGVKGKKILEIGSGKSVNGEFFYSVEALFDSGNEFIKSDIVEEYGHTVINLVELQSNEEFDIILCLNVLEHILEYEKAIENLWNALKPGGLGIILVPAFYPLHDEPHDYWRFTEHSLRILLKRFKNINIIHSGIRQYPFAYFAAFNK